AFAVVAGQTRVRGFLGAGEAMPAGPTDGRSDELAAREAVAVSLDDGQRLVAEDEQRLVHRWGAEEAFGNLAVGAAHSHFERAEEHFALACLDGRNVLDACRVGMTRLRDERLHLCGREPAVDYEDAPGHEARRIGGEVGDSLRDLIRCPQPPERLP